MLTLALSWMLKRFFDKPKGEFDGCTMIVLYAIVVAGDCYIVYTIIDLIAKVLLRS